MPRCHLILDINEKTLIRQAKTQHNKLFRGWSEPWQGKNLEVSGSLETRNWGLRAWTALVCPRRGRGLIWARRRPRPSTAVHALFGKLFKRPFILQVPRANVLIDDVMD